jgi:hypothetical protein
MSNSQIFTAEASEATATVDPLAVGDYHVLGIFLYIVSQCQCMKFLKFHEYVSKKGLLPLMEKR